MKPHKVKGVNVAESVIGMKMWKWPTSTTGESLTDRLTSENSQRDFLDSLATRTQTRTGRSSCLSSRSTWDETTLNEFFKSDLNRDGVITADEAVRAVEEGNNTTSYASTSSPSSSDTGSSLASSTPEPTGAEAPEARLVSYAERIIGRYDKNNDGKLTASEWTKMLINPAAADTNRDGIVTVNEYAIWMQSRFQKEIASPPSI